LNASSPLVDLNSIGVSLTKASIDLLGERDSRGVWTGELSCSALATATAISAFSLYLRNGRPSNDVRQKILTLRDRGIKWLFDQQNQDGGWGDTPKSYSNISTTMLTAAATELAGATEPYSSAISLARVYIDAQGGVKGLEARYGKDKTFAVPILTNAALAGQVSWRDVPPLPFEAAAVPQKYYHWMQMPVVSYAIPALVAIGQAKFYHDPPRNPITRTLRTLTRSRTLKVLERMQPSSGGYLEAIPLTSFVVMALCSIGQSESPVVLKGIEFLVKTFRNEGTWPIDTNLATWNTTLSINALANGLAHRTQTSTCDVSIADELFTDDSLLTWLLNCQNRTVHPFTNAAPGGWGWSDLSGAVPDADDTPGAMLALRHWLQFIERQDSAGQKSRAETRRAIETAAQAGASWLLSLQNRDGGWPTFCRGWGKLPFDRSGADITAHVLRGLHAWRELIEPGKLQRARQRGLEYLVRQQQDTGCWLPLWFGNQDHPREENPNYGTAKVLFCFRDLKMLDHSAAVKARAWLAGQQNSDGGWGGGESLKSSTGWLSSCEETALAVEALLDRESLPNMPVFVKKGLNWLKQAVAEDRHKVDSPIGFYFAKLWYHERLYPQIFTVSALGAATSIDDP
jgi:squalene-hopene/tetraprenyl-beta-curcumene cyclase